MATLGSVFTAIAVAYLAICVLMWLFQERLLFLPGIPGRSLDATPQAVGLPYEEVALPAADGVRLHGWWVPAAGARFTLLHLHGNAGNISHRLELLQIFHALGVNVLLFDYRGYGRSEGAPSEAGLQRDAEAAWAHLTQQRRLAPADIVVHGQSMGGAFAAWLAARRAPAGLILESAFTSARQLLSCCPRAHATPVSSSRAPSPWPRAAGSTASEYSRAQREAPFDANNQQLAAKPSTLMSQCARGLLKSARNWRRENAPSLLPKQRCSRRAMRFKSAGPPRRNSASIGAVAVTPAAAR